MPGKHRRGHQEEWRRSDGTEQRTVDHHRALVGTVRSDVFQAETFRKVEIKLDGGHLPGTVDGASRACTEIFGP